MSHNLMNDRDASLDRRGVPFGTGWNLSFILTFGSEMEIMNTDTPINAAPAGVRPPPKDIDFLNEYVAGLLKQQFTDDIRIIEEIIKNAAKIIEEATGKPCDGNALGMLHAAYRSRVLNTGNRLLRELPNVTKNFEVRQLTEYQSTHRSDAALSSINRSSPSLASLQSRFNQRPMKDIKPEGR